MVPYRTLTFSPSQDQSCVDCRTHHRPAIVATGEAVSTEAGQQAANEAGYVYFGLGKVASADDDALDGSFETITERILDMKEGHGHLSPGSGTPLSSPRPLPSG
jgi:hypothetical protein